MQEETLTRLVLGWQQQQQQQQQHQQHSNIPHASQSSPQNLISAIVSQQLNPDARTPGFVQQQQLLLQQQQQLLLQKLEQQQQQQPIPRHSQLPHALHTAQQAAQTSTAPSAAQQTLQEMMQASDILTCDG
jgi:hypothetical protein